MSVVTDKNEVSVFIYSSGTLVSSGAQFTDEVLGSGQNNSMHISNGGVASDTEVLTGGKMLITGGTAEGAILTGSNYTHKGEIHVSNGGVANDVIASDDGYLYVSSGGTVNGTILNNRGFLYVSKGGVADSTTINSSGWMYVYEGTATNTLANKGAYVYISSGSIATETTISGGMVTIDKDAVASNTTVSSGWFQVSSGVANGVLLTGDQAYLYVTLNGCANDVTVDDGNVSVSSGTINRMKVNKGKTVQIYGAGVVNSAELNNDAKIYVSSGGTASSTIVNSTGQVYVYGNGVAKDTTVSSGGLIAVSAGANATNIILNAGGYLGGFAFAEDKVIDQITDGTFAVAENASIVGRTMNITEGGEVSDITVGRIGSMHISNGGAANRIEVLTGGSMFISNGGVATSATLNSLGRMYVSEGGIANLTTINSGGSMVISNGGVANNTIQNSSGFMRISNGGVANDTTMNYRGYMYVYDGGVANRTKLDGGGVYVSSGGVASNTEVNYNGYMYVYVDGSVKDTTVSSGGLILLNTGGSAENLILNAGGWLGGFAFTENKVFDRITNGAAVIADNVSVTGWKMNITGGGVVSNTVIRASGVMNIADGGMASNTTVRSKGSILISSGGIHRGGLQLKTGAVVSAYEGSTIDFTLTDRTPEHGYLINNLAGISGTPTYTITVSADQAAGTYKLALGAESFTGSMTIKTETEIYGTLMVNGDVLKVGDVSYELLNYGSDNLVLNIHNHNMIVSSGSVASGTQIFDGKLTIPDGAVTSDTTVNSGGSMLISSGGVASNTIVSSGGQMILTSAGTATDTTVSSGGKMYLSSGGIHSGEFQIVSGAVVSASEGAKIDFTLTDRTPEDGYLINDLSLISGNPTYTITVSADPAVGTYKLAQGAADFDQVITIGNGSVDYGFLSVNGPAITVGKKDYSLVLDGGSLTLNVAYSDIAGPILNITGNPTGWTNRDVVLTASASDSPSGLATIEYSLDNVDWIKGESVSVSRNGTVYFRATDNAGNITTQSVVVNWIDKDAPTVGRLTVKQQDQNKVLLTAGGFTDNSKIARYDFYLAGKKIGSSTNWIFTYNSTSNLTGTLNFSVKTADIVENISAAASSALPITVTVVGRATEKTTSIRWAAASMSGGVKQYEIRVSGMSKTFKSKTNSVTLKKLTAGNHTVTIYAINKAKQRVLVASGAPLYVNDITAPKGGKVKLSQRNQNSVLVSISGFTDNVKVARYDIYLNGRKVGSTTSNSYVYNGKNLAGSLKFSVRAFDAAGNAAKDKIATIKIKDATAPDRVVGLRVVGKANEKVTTLSWNRAGDNVGVTQYEIRVSGSSKVYKSKTTSITIKKLSAGAHTFTVTAIDKAKNRSVVSQSVKFTVLDGTAPKGGKVSLSQLNANSVRVSISGFTDNVKVARYDIYLNGAKVGSTSTNSFTYKGGSALSGSLKFSVMAVDAAGNVSKAKNATLKIKAAPAARSMPEGPLDLEIGGIASNSFARLPDERNSAAPGAALKGFISGTAGVDVVEFAADLSRYLDGMSLGAGNDTVILEQSGTPSVVDVDPLSGYGLMDLGAGNDLVRLEANTELESALDLGLGNDTLIIEKGATLDLDIAGLDFGAGSDKLVLNGTLEVDCGLISGLETVVGNGEVIISGSGSVDDSLKSKFKNAGIKVTTIA